MLHCLAGCREDRLRNWIDAAGGLSTEHREGLSGGELHEHQDMVIDARVEKLIGLHGVAGISIADPLLENGGVRSSAGLESERSRAAGSTDRVSG